MKMSELSEKWVDMKSAYVKRSTLAAYKLHLRVHILPAMGDYEIDRIKIDTLQELLNSKIKSGLSVKTVKDVMLTIKMILGYAMELELIPNRVFKLKYPSVNIKSTNKTEAYSVDDQKRIIQYVTENPSPRNLGILIDLCTGLRIGELCALKWENVDLDAKVIKVRKTVSRIYDPNEFNKTTIEFSQPKTVNSNRDIPIQKDLYVLLKKYKAIARDDYFVISGSASLIEPRTYSSYYKDLITNKIGLQKRIKFHGLRHSFATRLVESGAEITAVSKIMGHSNVGITMNLYVHPTTSSKENCINKSMKGMF